MVRETSTKYMTALFSSFTGKLWNKLGQLVYTPAQGSITMQCLAKDLEMWQHNLDYDKTKNR